MRKMLSLLFICSLLGCGNGFDPQEIVKPLRSDSKLAYTIINHQVTTCKEECLSDFLVQECYERYLEEGEDSDPACIQECINVCPLQYIEFHCIDLQKELNDPRRYYVIKTYDWQRDVRHLTGYYFHTQIKRLIAQPMFMCEQDLALCQNHFEPIKALQRFLYEIEE